MYDPVQVVKGVLEEEFPDCRITISAFTAYGPKPKTKPKTLMFLEGFCGYTRVRVEVMEGQIEVWDTGGPGNDPKIVLRAELEEPTSLERMVEAIKSVGV